MAAHTTSGTPIPLISVNTHPKLVQARLGHASIKTMLDVYGHRYDPLDTPAANELEQLIAQTTARETRAIDERGL